MRQIVFRDGVLYDMQWNAITPTFEELNEIAIALSKYATIKIQEGSL